MMSHNLFLKPTCQVDICDDLHGCMFNFTCLKKCWTLVLLVYTSWQEKADYEYDFSLCLICPALSAQMLKMIMKSVMRL